MSELKVGTVVSLTNGATCKVKKELGKGGQGFVYLAEVGGRDMALKWYHKNPSTDVEGFYKNLKNNASSGAPSPAFLWPKYVANKQYGSFGYVMDLRPQGYYEFSEFLVAKQKFSSFFARTTAAMEICEGFKALHARGLSYQDLNDGNFFIDPNTGHVKICDNDNAFPNGQKSGVLGKARYMAPEVVVGKTLPDAYSDKFSLAVILFMLFCGNHPFEGVKVASTPCLTEAHEKKFYGSEPVFICDPYDKSNQPVRGEHTNVINSWPLIPAILRKAFVEEFGNNKLQNPTRRFTEQQWLDTITIIRDLLVRCPYCGEESFVDNSKIENKCSNKKCGKNIKVVNSIVVNRRILPIVYGKKMYLDRDDIPDLQIVEDPNDTLKLKIKNLTPDPIIVETTKGTTKRVEPQDVMPVKVGLVLHVKVRGAMYKCEVK